MSPVDPVSPISPMDVSPTAPTMTRTLSADFTIPATPIIGLSVPLPRLVTSFQTTNSDTGDPRRPSLQFQLPTPSPLSLQQSPVTAIYRKASGTCHKRGGTISLRRTTMLTSPTLPINIDTLSTISPTSQAWPQRTTHSPTTSATPSIPDHQNAMEQPSDMQTHHSNPCCPLDLPVRSRRRSTTTPSPSHRKLRSPHTKSTASTTTTTTTTRTLPRHTRSSIRKPAAAPSSTRTELCLRLAHLSQPLAPLISVTTGFPHPSFPRTLLEYHLLTHSQLDDLARHYHQTTDAGQTRWRYPCPIGLGKVWCASYLAASTTTNTIARSTGESIVVTEAKVPGEKSGCVDLATKRRRWGRFIGLMGCESPTDGSEEEDLVERMEKEWNEGRRRMQEAERVEEKIWGRRF